MSWEIREILPDAQGYNRLRARVGWPTYAEDATARALGRSLYGVCAYWEGELIGMARVVGDGVLVFYIQDVIVHPDYQRRGIGRQLMAHVMAYLGAHASPHAVVGLMAAQGKERFYASFGLTARPTERLGCGMTLFWPG